MISLFLSTIIAVFAAWFYEKRLKKKKQIIKEEEENRKVYFEQGDRQVAYKMQILHQEGLTEIHLFSVQPYGSPKEVLNNCDALVWGEIGLELNMGGEQIYLPWTSVYQIKMTIEEEMRK